MPNTPSRPLIAAAAALFAATALVASSGAQEAPGEAATQDPQKVEVRVEDAGAMTTTVEHKRIPVPSLSLEANQPFTIEVPVNWETRRELAATGVFLGPPGGDPNSHPEMLLLRESTVALETPETILTNLRAHAETADWSLEEGETRDFGGVEGLWIVRRMAPSGFHGERVNYAVKLPLGDRSLDVLATVPAEQQEALEPAIRHMLLSIRPAEAAPPETED